MEQGESLATDTDPLVQWQIFSRKASYGKSWKEDTRSGQGTLVNSGIESRGSVVAEEPWVPPATPQTGLHPKKQWQTPAARHPYDEGQGHAGAIPTWS